MKKIVVLHLAMILLTSHLCAQTKNDYMLKSKNQKTAAWILLGGGTTLGIISTYKMIGGIQDVAYGQTNNKISASLLFGLFSAAAILGSVPLFISSSKNKNRAINLTIGSQPMPALVMNITGSAFIPSLDLKISL